MQNRNYYIKYIIIMSWRQIEKVIFRHEIGHCLIPFPLFDYALDTRNQQEFRSPQVIFGAQLFLENGIR